MSLKTRYILLISLIHLLLLALSYRLFSDARSLFLIAEFFILLSIALSLHIYRQLIRPLSLLAQGTDAIRDKDFNTKFRKTGRPETDKLVEVYNEMMDELRRERVLQQEQNFFLQKLIRTAPVGILVLDHDQRIVEINPAFSEFADTGGWLGLEIGEPGHPILDAARELAAGTHTIVQGGQLNTYKIHKAQFIDRGFPRQFIIVEDLTATLWSAEKKLYGKLIRMMAHEVNNTTGPVHSILNSALDSAAIWNRPESEPYEAAISVALERTRNLSAFTRSLADLVKLPAPAITTTDLKQILQGVTALMNAQAKERNISIALDLPPVTIRGDKLQLEQAFINILKNAMEAIVSDGHIRIFMDEHGQTLYITDDGKGIDPEQASELFQPFFSTKKDGQGLGLMLVREILQSHGFGFSLQSKDRITEFAIRFS